MQSRFYHFMTVMAVLGVLLFSAQALWGHDAVKPWMLPALWAFIAYMWWHEARDRRRLEQQDEALRRK